MVDAEHGRYVVLYHHLKNAIGRADYAALEAMAAQLRSLPNGRERRVACIALHHAATGSQLHLGEAFERLLCDLDEEEGEELLLRLADVWRCLDDARRLHSLAAPRSWR